MAGYLAVGDDFTLTAAGLAVVAKEFPRRTETTAAIGTEGSRAESAAKSHTDTLVASDRSRLTVNESSLTQHAGRIGQLEILGGLEPGNVSDATVASLVINDETNTGTAIDARVRPIIAKRLGVSPEDYGAVGDGITDDSAAVQAALNVAATGGVLNLSGHYFMGDTLISATLSGPIGISGSGAGTLVWNSGSGIRLYQNNADHVYTFYGLNLYTHAKGTGVAIEVIGSGQNTGSGLQPRTKHRGQMSNLNIRGIRDTGINGWGKHIRTVDIMNCMYHQIHIDGYQPNQGNFVSTHGIEIVTDPISSKAVDVVLSQVYIYLVQYALDAQGYEGVSCDQCFFIGVGVGFRFDPVDAGAPLVTFTNGQIAFKTKGLDFHRSSQGNISGSLIYTHSTSGAPSTAIGITLTDCTSTRITGNTFVANNGMGIGILIQGSLSRENTIESDMFYIGITTPVSLGAGTTRNKVRDLDLASPTTQTIINNGAASNEIEGQVLGFYGATPVAKPQLPASPTVQQLVDALKAVGLIGQA